MKANRNSKQKQMSVYSDDEKNKNISVIELKFRRIFAQLGFHSIDALFILNQNKLIYLN